MMSPTACQIVHETLQELATWIRKQPNVGEESLTDWFLYTLSERIPRIHYVKFTRLQEARETGADWEWWLVGRDASLGIRIQAKRLAKGDNYPALAYSNKHGLQIERLRDNAARQGLLSFYSFYSDGSLGDRVMCGGRVDAGIAEGAFLVDATTLYSTHIQSGRATIPPGVIVRASNPMSCFVCCPLASGSGGDEVARIYEFIQRYHPRAVDESMFPEHGGRWSHERVGLHAYPPDYIHSLLDVAAAGGSADGWKAEFHASELDAQALLIWDLR